MATLLESRPAPGGPGAKPRWTFAGKDGVGTAYSASSRVWFTVSRGMLTEVYYPTIDRPQTRDLQYLVTDGATFFQDEGNLESTCEYIGRDALGLRIISSDPKGRFRLFKEIIADPHLCCVLVNTRLEADPVLLPRLRLFALLAPHLEVSGWGNNGHVAVTHSGDVLSAHKGDTWLALGASSPFLRCSCGYTGTSDGWQDLAANFQMNSQFDCALDGNIALIGELDLRRSQEFVLGLAFGESLHNALVTLSQSLGVPFAEHRKRFIEQWRRAERHLTPEQEKCTGDSGRLYHVSHSLLLAHADKLYDGATIASVSIPWGDAREDDDLGGYHLVWTRDLYHSATGLLAAGDAGTPLRALIYLACSQRPNGGFPQNFWINGETYRDGVQLDETAFPILLARRLRQADALREFDPYPMVMRAAGYLLDNHPVTDQDRWEESGGYSPSTLAATIAALICAAAFARERGRPEAAQYLEEYADFLEAHVEPWTVTTEGTLLAGVTRHYIRIHPVTLGDRQPDEDPNRGSLTLANQPAGTPAVYPAKEIVDAGFLELVRYGVRRPGDPLIEDSLRVVDAVLKVNTPAGPCWRRYNHDGYGQRADGGPFLGSGTGHAWPLLTCERGHYELAAGREVQPFLRTIEGLANATGLLPEQVWSLPDRPEDSLFLGRPTGAAMPLAWAHAEYLRLVRSAADGRVFELIPEVAERYLRPRLKSLLEVWQFNRQVRAVPTGGTLRVQAPVPFQLRWTSGEWSAAQDVGSRASRVGAEFVDVPVPRDQRALIRFTFFWTEPERWEDRNYEVSVAPG